MVEPKDAILPVLQRIQEDVAAIRKEQPATKERLVEITDAVMTTQEDVAEIRRDNLRHLGLNTKHHLEFVDFRDELRELKARVTALESRS